MSRVKNVKKNVLYGYIGHIITLLLSFVSRTIFINTLGVVYLGVSGLFTNILGVLSFAELGIGSAMTYALYKPAAENNIEELKSLIYFYKIAYRWIALIIAIIGLAILPFLNIIVKDPGDVGDISLYYVLYLINTVASYFVIYKYTLANAYQKKYFITNTITVFTMATTLINIVALLIFKNFLVYLSTIIFMQLLQNLFINIYMNKKYSFLKSKDVKKLTKEQLLPIKKNVFALVWHTISRVSIKQTDNIIISAFVSITMVGLISNYNLIIKTVTTFISVGVAAIMGSLGNLIATECKKKQYKTYKLYSFIMFWVYGFCSIAFLILADPFITLWIGNDMTIPEITWFIIVFDFYLQGNFTALVEVKTASGIFQQDKWIVIILAIINIVVSIIMVQIIGLTGVFVGTIFQRFVSYALRPRIVYKYVFDMKVKEFYVDTVKYFIPVAISAAICMLFRNYIVPKITLLNLFINAAVIVIIPNLSFYLMFRKSEELKKVKSMIFNNLIFKSRKVRESPERINNE